MDNTKNRKSLFAHAPMAKILQVVGSTNTLAKEAAAKGALHGSVFVAQQQTAGRGRLGRLFVSPPGGIYISIVLRGQNYAGGAGILTAGAAVAVCRAVSIVCGRELEIKWVNDLLWQQKKCCGILAEAAWVDGKPDYYVLGMGLNYTTTSSAMGAELAQIATSLYPNGDAPADAMVLASEIYTQSMQVFDNLPSGDFLQEYRQRCIVLGRSIKVLANPPYTALALAVDDEARLLLRLQGGEEKLLQSGEISIRL